MPLTPNEHPAIAINLGRVVLLIVRALGKQSDGGAKITVAEWAEIGVEAGLVAAKVARDVRD
jgi:hypothetical protein